MVTDPRAPTGTHRLRPLKRPTVTAVEADRKGLPIAVLERGVFRRVTGIYETWRIDDEWWRETIARRYFAVELDGNRRLTIYHDLVTDAWYSQSYEAPVRSDRKAG